ncbi:hypothetical protein SmJEL517_g03966 [Synchytrium microbalum]|uniref:protein acetyllysine N-acetyltransferase n=1 Tax=Synchytrium microbalum TaxID=1806994 RepID=A0A507C4S6_9FUNG|nr:uncharacterized protein SmJEL517_g03966 [Synchytrium microbalum]TPX32996.1 hypothetical protein SmJEL517_g03966 [Synchytrium microbalum]
MDTALEDTTEFFDSDEELQVKIKEFATLLRKSTHTVFFTGAGISTSAGIPDFRGPTGIWTLQAKGLPTPSLDTMNNILPTPTHMAMVALQDRNMLKFVISQNVDGLHLRSGIKPHALAELHGNTNIERCLVCSKHYYRPFRVRPLGAADPSGRHLTGRKCEQCVGLLRDSIVHFGEGLPDRDLEAGFEHSRKCDLMVVLGSSLSVYPAAELPHRAAQAGAQFVIINLQRTPMDDLATLRIFAQVDRVMVAVMKELNMLVPPVQDLQKELADSQVAVRSLM